jgi:hypothetical protein
LVLDISNELPVNFKKNIKNKKMEKVFVSMIDNYDSLNKLPEKLNKIHNVLRNYFKDQLLKYQKQLFIVSNEKCDYLTFINEVNEIVQYLSTEETNEQKKEDFF